MRMDRYTEDLTNDDFKKTRTNKNQELYADVYLNNVYVDINNLKDVMYQEEDDIPHESIKSVSIPTVDYTYIDKNYDIVSLVSEAIKNKEEDNIKRDMNFSVSETDLNSLIESINETIGEKEKNVKENEELLSDLLPNDENTTVIPPLDEPILDKALTTSEIVQMEKGKLKEEVDNSLDDSFLDEDSSKLKIVLIILIPIIIILIVLGVLLYKNII